MSRFEDENLKVSSLKVISVFDPQERRPGKLVAYNGRSLSPVDKITLKRCSSLVTAITAGPERDRAAAPYRTAAVAAAAALGAVTNW